MWSFFFVCFAVIQLLLAAYLLQPTFLLLIYGMKRLFGSLFVSRKMEDEVNEKEFSYALIITAHKNLQLVPPLVDSALRQTYRRFKVYVVADDCEHGDIGFNDDPAVKVLLPSDALHAKIRSIDYAIRHFDEPHDVLIILDADNLLHPNYLEELNKYFVKGYRAVQTNALPKNVDSVYAQLDAAGGYFNGFVDRHMRMEMGLSANICGFGTAIETNLYKQIIYRNFLGGFDKKVQSDIVKLIPQLAYAEKAKVYEEKVDTGDAMETQRTRWINAYFRYFTNGWNVFMTGVQRGNFNLMFFGFNLLRPPLFLQLGGAAFFALVNYWISPAWMFGWLVAMALFPLSFIGIVAVMSTDKKVLGAFFYLPMVVFRQVKALLRIGRANKAFLQTQNNKIVYIQDLLSQ
jgi:cellulose synthase/poly-beta-1,6-N-acetylglucosamine synthase-like glycosyltransferase